jgi:hypothetical protein
VARDCVTGHLARVDNVVEDDQPALVVLSRAGVKREVGRQRITRREIEDSASCIDIDVRRRIRIYIAVDRGVRKF